jgi:universal stress protein E
MNKITRILVVLDGGADDAIVVPKAVTLAHQHGAALELFLCDAQCAYSLLHSYDQTNVAAFRRQSILRSRRYLDGQREIASTSSVPVTTDAACESPLYEAIVRKVVGSRADFVIKSAASSNPQRRFALEASDWQLMRACPVTLLLSRGKAWQPTPRFLAAVDVSGTESPELPGTILRMCTQLSRGSHGRLDVVYSESVATTPAENGGRIERLHALASASGIGPDAGIRVVSGEPEIALPAFAAARGYDAIVMGALTHRKGLAALVGTLTSKLIESLDCDFVLVKPDGYQTDIDFTTIPVEASANDSGYAAVPQSPAAPGFVSAWQLPGR